MEFKKQLTEDKLNQLIEEFEKFRLNNDFEYGWKKKIMFG